MTNLSELISEDLEQRVVELRELKKLCERWCGNSPYTYEDIERLAVLSTRYLSLRAAADSERIRATCEKVRRELAEARLEKVRELLADIGCDCDCCLACRIAGVVS